MTHLTYLEAAVVGLIQGVSELFPVSSLGHNVLLPALVGGSWEADLNVAEAESPYLAFIVGLHVATALALLAYFRRDWVRIIGGFGSSIRDRRVETADQRLAWMIVFPASSEPAAIFTCSMFRSRLSELVASCTKSTTAGRSAVCASV